MSIATIDPTTNRVVKKFREISDKILDQKLNEANRSLSYFSRMPMAQRSKNMKEVADLLLLEKKKYANLITLEMGKPIQESLAEIEKCAKLCEYYAENAKHFLKEVPIETDASSSYISYAPLGMVLGIMPWNYPFWQAFRFAVPAIMAGNLVLLKHAPNVPQCALAIEDIFKKAGQSNCLVNLFIRERKVKRVLEHPGVKMVSLTGSDAAGSAVAAIAGKNIKRTVLELGGSDPFIVFDDANLKMAAEIGTRSRMMNAGQSCIAAKRFIVLKPVLEQFTDLLMKNIAQIKVGDPSDPSNSMGPMAREDLARQVIKQIKASVKRGASLLTGGNRPIKQGAYVAPTLLTGVKPGMPVFDEEVFGPVASVIVASDEEEAILLANNTQYGLGASIWTEDMDRAQRLTGLIRSGSVFINAMVKSDPRMPFGGINRSGYGRELSYHGIQEFVNIKSVWKA